MATNGRMKTVKEATKPVALKTAYNAILAASFSLASNNVVSAQKILEAALHELNVNYTAEVQKAIGIQ